MLDVLDECDKLTEDSLVNRLDKEIVDSEVGYWSLIRGITPCEKLVYLTKLKNKLHFFRNSLVRCE